MVSIPHPFTRSLIVLAALGLSACASLPPDLGRSEVSAAVLARGQALPNGDTSLLSSQLLAQPLTPDNAITLALIHNPAVRQTTAQLGLSAADVYDAARVANPVFSANRLTTNDPAAVSAQIGLGIALSFTDLIFLPARSRYAKAQFEAAKLNVGSATLALASEVQSAWYVLAGAEQCAMLKTRVASAAQASADLAQRYFAAGNINKRELALEGAAATQAKLASLTAEAEVERARSALNRLMGLPATQDQWQLAGGLPAPLASEDELDALLKLASENRLDVAAARRNAEAIASTFGLERRTQLLGPIELSYERERETDGSRLIGPGVSVAIPLFNWGTGRVTRAKAQLDAAEADLAAKELDASNDVKAAHAAVRSAKAMVERYRENMIPQREAVVEQMQLEVNYMLIGVFELLAAKQQQYDAYAGYLDAVRDYWLARTELTRAVGRKLPSSDQPAPDTLDAAALAKPKAGGMEHGAMGHGSMDHGSMGHGAMGHDMSTRPEMEGMDHSGHDMSKMEGEKIEPDAPSTPEMDHSGHDMSSMPGMERPTAAKPAASEDNPRARQQTEMPVQQQSADPSPSAQKPARPHTDHQGH